MQRRRITITGAVQSVGFRPYIYGLARRHNLPGWVANSRTGVTIEIEGAPERITAFCAELPVALPPRARLDSLHWEDIATEGADRFVIADSLMTVGPVGPILPDLATCPQCLAEMNDPGDRRHRYPFLNCTDCGPRFSIIEAMPYDRRRTTMRRFPLCPDCESDYHDPLNRRFHAEPIACPRCGPQLALWDREGRVLSTGEDGLQAAIAALTQGQIVAVKGLGGFHLMVDATQTDAVLRLRQRKQRPHKPLAMLVPDLACLAQFCDVPPEEEALLTSVAAPILLVRRRPDPRLSLAPAIAPDLPYLGVMLPATPLHHLLMQALRRPIVATSGNRAQEPIVIDESEVVARLGGIADLFLVHDRPIVRPLDDSVLRWAAGRPLFLRRARGYAPAPIALPAAAAEPPPRLLALGSFMKATVTITQGDQAIVSQHLGDLENAEARRAYGAAIQDLPRLTDAPPTRIAHDLHPDFAALSQDWLAEPLPTMAVQHHLAHIAAVIGEHRSTGPVLGFAWDGTGWGEDGTIWGGETLLVEGKDWRRVAHLRPFRLPGGDRAAREPRRAALGLLRALCPDDAAWTELAGRTPLVTAFSDGERQVLLAAIDRGLNAPRCSSVGRLFDAVAALLDLRQITSHEGEAAMLLEASAGRHEGAAQDPGYDFPLRDSADGRIIDWEPAIRQLCAERAAGVATAAIAWRFHRGLSHAIVAIAQAFGLPQVALAGGCFQNVLLLEQTIAALTKAGIAPLWNRDLPPNDGSISYGQAVWAAR